VYSEGARRGGAGSRQVCGQGIWNNSEPDTHTVCDGTNETKGSH
jgi:hypothetical protein